MNPERSASRIRFFSKPPGEGFQVKICLLSSHESQGGAAIDARRLHESLLRCGEDSVFLVGRRTFQSPATFALGPEKFCKLAHCLPLLKNPGIRRLQSRWQPRGFWSSNLIGRPMAGAILGHRPDVINLHWVGEDFLPVEEIGKLTRPVVWTLHDQWAFTGGCHYSGGCERFVESCGECPLLVPAGGGRRASADDLSGRIHAAKETAWRNLDLTVVAPSDWLASLARRSRLFRNRRIETIRYGLDLDVFRPLDKALCRQQLGLPQDKTLILFGAVSPTDERRKGYQELVPALGLAGQELGDTTAVAILGAHHAPGLGMPAFPVGALRDEVSLPLIYSACDLIVVPSLEDNSPNVIYEAAACGVPAVAFGVGGIPEMIDEGVSGHLVPSRDVRSLASAVVRVASDSAHRSRLAAGSRAMAVRNYSAEAQANAYRKLFGELISR